MKHAMKSNLKIIVFEDCKACTYTYYVGEEDDIVTVFMLNVDEEVWNVVCESLESIYMPESGAFTNDEITWEMLEAANLGYMEEEDIAIYCDTATGYNYKRQDNEYTNS